MRNIIGLLAALTSLGLSGTQAATLPSSGYPPEIEASLVDIAQARVLARTCPDPSPGFDYSDNYDVLVATLRELGFEDRDEGREAVRERERTFNRSGELDHPTPEQCQALVSSFGPEGSVIRGLIEVTQPVELCSTTNGGCGGTPTD